MAGPATTAALTAGPRSGELRQALTAARAHRGLVASLLALAALAWWSTAARMAGMDAGPGTDVGALGWFLSVWVVMMAAMMLPSLAPTVALYASVTRRHASATRRRGLDRPLLFAAAYVVVWGAAGLIFYGVFRAGKSAYGHELAWSRGGRWLAAGVLVAAAGYELTTLKGLCLKTCRHPVRFLAGNWRSGRRGAAELGIRHAAWCFGCCWALMAGLFALGVMSVTWMLSVAAVIALEKLLPWGRQATWVTAAVLVALGLAVLVAPGSVPGLVVPGGAHGAVHAMVAPMR